MKFENDEDLREPYCFENFELYMQVHERDRDNIMRANFIYGMGK